MHRLLTKGQTLNRPDVPENVPPRQFILYIKGRETYGFWKHRIYSMHIPQYYIICIYILYADIYTHRLRHTHTHYTFVLLLITSTPSNPLQTGDCSDKGFIQEIRKEFSSEPPELLKWFLKTTSHWQVIQVCQRSYFSANYIWCVHTSPCR